MQVGLVLSLPNLVSCLVEPILGVLADAGWRRRLILIGGVVYIAGLLLFAVSPAFLPLLLAAVLLSPASGSFVSLSQATLMDLAPERHERNMARWTLAGSVGVVAGPLAIGAGSALGAGWRTVFAACAVLSILTVMLVWRRPFPAAHPESAHQGFRTGVHNALGALRRREVLRWLILLECSDLLLDVFLGFVALYFRDVVKTTPATAGLSVAVWTATGLVGNVLLLRLLERVAGLRYLWISTALTLILFPAFLLTPGAAPKLALLGMLGLITAGWYPVLQGRLYSAMPGQSGTVMSVGNLFGIGRALIPLAIAAVAERFTLGAALWLLLLGPLALLIGLPRASWKATVK